MVSNNGDNSDYLESRYDLQAMLEEIRTEEKTPGKKIAEQAEISALFKKSRDQSRLKKDD